MFALGVIALAANVAKADGEVTRDELRAFFRRVSPFEAEKRPSYVPVCGVGVWHRSQAVE